MSFEDVYKNESDYIYKYLYMKLKDHYAAEDITSDVFCKAFAAYERYDSSKASVRTWLVHIAHNILMDYFRRGSRIRFEDIESPAVSASVCDDYPSYYGESVAELYRAVDSLSEDDRALLLLAYGGGAKNGELSEAYGITKKAVSERKRRAIKRLRKKYRYSVEDTCFFSH